MAAKTCNACNVEKPLGEFYRVRKGNPARQPRCKVCDNAKRSGYLKNYARVGPREDTPETGASYGQIASEVGVSPQRVQQIELAALSKLRKAAAARGIR